MNHCPIAYLFQFIGIWGLAFLSSIVMVAIILPNVYFRVMLRTDRETSASDPREPLDFRDNENSERLDLLSQSNQEIMEDETKFLEKLFEAHRYDGFMMKSADLKRLKQTKYKIY